MITYVSMEHASMGSVAFGNVTGRSDTSGTTRTVTITATEGWSGPDWDRVAKALNAHDDYIETDYRLLDDDSEQWRIVYRRTDEQA